MDHPKQRQAPPYTPEQVDDLIAQAEAAAGMLPTHDHCRHLNDALRQVIDHLAGQVRARRGEQAERSRGWYECDNLLTDTQAALDETMGSGLRSAALHVADLGRQCRKLTLYVRAGV